MYIFIPTSPVSHIHVYSVVLIVKKKKNLVFIPLLSLESLPWTHAARDKTLLIRVFDFPQVSWIRQEDLMVLATNEITFTTDERFKVRLF